MLDMATPRRPLILSAGRKVRCRLNQCEQNLRIVSDYLPSLSATPQEHMAYDAIPEELAPRSRIYAKCSAIDRRGSQRRVAFHKEKLDRLMATFGEDRVVLGTDWPNSWGVATLAEIMAPVRAYFATRTHEAAEKFFWRNSLEAYRWQKRAANQSG